ncbi:MAG: hypothetical protein FD150_1024 [Rhodobacteraceae bacterium]|nr:MAG: hypothetical protein FD150_1024 [Paracoccaceae bacterium]
MRRVNHSEGLHALSDLWRNLAEQSGCLVTISACGVRRSGAGSLPDGSAMQVLPVQPSMRSALSGPNVPYRCADQKREAAYGRVGGQGDPGRQGQGNGCTHRDDPDCGGQDDEPGKHFAQPPREDWNQDARRAWREYGRVLVKVRRSSGAFQRIPGMQSRAKQGFSPLGGRRSVAQPRVDSCRSIVNVSGNLLKRNTSIKDRSILGGQVARSAANGPAGVRCAAAIRHDSVIRNKAAIREVDEDCLSFVIPQQQGVAAARHGDTK